MNECTECGDYMNIVAKCGHCNVRAFCANCKKTDEGLAICRSWRYFRMFSDEVYLLKKTLQKEMLIDYICCDCFLFEVSDNLDS